MHRTQEFTYILLRIKIRYRVLLVLVAVTSVTGGMVVAWYSWQNYQGNRAWDETRRNLEARGETLTLAPFIPPPVPDDENLAFAPLFVRLYQYKVDPKTGLMTFNHDGNTHASATVDTLPYGKDGLTRGTRVAGPTWNTGHALDLAALQKYFSQRPDFPHPPQPQTPAEDLRLALTRFDPLLEEVAQAAKARPTGRFPVNWTQQPAGTIAMPHNNFVQVLVSTLRLRATASLATGRSEEALQDITLALRLIRTIEEEPTLISNLVVVTCLQLLMQPVWEGLGAHRWNPAQIMALQAELSRIDVIRDFARGCRGERAFFLLPSIDDLNRERSVGQVLNMLQMTGSTSTLPRFMSLSMSLFPSGWFAEAKAVTCQLDQRDIIDPIRPSEHRILARKSEMGTAEIYRLPLSTSTYMAKISLPVSASVTVKIAYGQAFVDEAVVACALERYYLAHHDYPEELAALVPALIERVPQDVIDSASMRYQQTPGGRYQLWEAGWNGTDEGGRTVLLKGLNKVDMKQGDWVWQDGVID